MPNTETENTVKRITFRLSPKLFAQATEYVEERKVREPKYSLNDFCLEAVDAVSSKSSPLGRYRRILGVGKQELRAAFSEAELNMIMDACNGIALWYEMGERPFVVTQPGQVIAVNVGDAIQLNQLDKKWGVAPELPAKIAALSVPAQYALADLIERFWEQPQSSVMELL
jgi:hypothetical protein